MSRKPKPWRGWKNERARGNAICPMPWATAAARMLNVCELEGMTSLLVPDPPIWRFSICFLYGERVKQPDPGQYPKTGRYRRNRAYGFPENGCSGRRARGAGAWPRQAEGRGGDPDRSFLCSASIMASPCSARWTSCCANWVFSPIASPAPSSGRSRPWWWGMRPTAASASCWKPTWSMSGISAGRRIWTRNSGSISPWSRIIATAPTIWR